MRESLELRRQLAVSLLDIEFVERFRNERLETIQLFGVEGLLDVVVRTLAHSLDGGVYRSLSRNDDGLGWNRQPLELLQQRKTIELRHLEVGENDSELVRAQLIDCFFS